MSSGPSNGDSLRDSISFYHERTVKTLLKLTSRDSQARGEVIQNCPDGCLSIQRGVHRIVQTNYRDEDNQRNIEPVDMLMPVGPSYFLVGNVDFGGGGRLGRRLLRRFSTHFCNIPPVTVDFG